MRDNGNGNGGQKRPGRFGIWVRRIVIAGFALALLGMIALGTSVYVAAGNLPSFSELRETKAGQTIVVRARDGTEIVAIGPSYGQWLTSDEIPQVMKDAMVAVEDRRYYSHPGIDPLGLMRALWISLRDDAGARATSTITQQLARNIFLNSNRTFDRKAREAVLAMALEWKFSKEQILELYLNKVYFGGGAYGIDSASRNFFSHSAKELSLPEAAIIAGLVKAPSRYSPRLMCRPLSAARMWWSNRCADMVQLVLPTLQKWMCPPSSCNLKGQNSVRYFTDWVLPQLDLILPETQQALEVWTTLDVGMQRTATAAIAANTPGSAQGALVSLDRDGAVLALVGGKDYVTSNYNRAVNSTRQPGSAWKLFVYLAALEAGYTPDDRVVDEPVTIEGWTPRNSGGTFAGEIDVRSAFAYSKNTVAASLGNEVGFGSVASMARRFGITTPINTNPSMVLGTSDVRLIDMTRAFAAVSARGQSIEPYGITKVTTVNGDLLYQREKVRTQQLVPDYVAAGITDLLQSAVATGTGRAAQIGRPVAGKTGTTSSNKDGWFLGFSSGITTGVWMGRDDARAVPGLQGGTAPARAFASYMRYAVNGRPVEKFDTELKLPDWQLEPDEEFMMGDPGDYYYVDEQGNLIEPSASDGERGMPFPVEGEQPVGDGGLVPVNPAGAPPAASDDFLERATGGNRSNGNGRPADGQRQQNSAPQPRSGAINTGSVRDW